METLATLAADVAWFALWLVACLPVGVAFCSALSAHRTTRQGLWPNPELALFFALCAGLALQVILLILLALLHLLRPVPIPLAFAGLAALSLAYLARDRASWKDFTACFHLPGAEWLKVAPIVLLILPWILRPLGPATGSDALTYHLPYARFYLEHGSLAVDETLRYPLHTHNVNLLYSAALIRPGATLTQLLHAAMGWLALLGVYGIVRHWRGWLAALPAAAGTLMFGEFVYSFSTAFVDNGAMLFVTAAFLALALWSEGGSRSLLWCAALFAGTAMGAKYLCALFTVPLGLWVLWHSRSLALTMRFALAVAVFGLFWYLRSWWISGNPVHPFAGEIFGYWLWTPEELVGQMLELGGHGVDRTLLNFLLLPERLFSARASFSGDTAFGGLLIGAFMLGCLLLPWQRPAVRMLQIAGFAWLVFWFSSAQVIRYLTLAVPLMSVAAAMSWTGLVMRVTGTRDPETGALAPRFASLNSVALVFTLAAQLAFAARWLQIDLHRVPLRTGTREAFLLKTEPSYAMALAAEADSRIGNGPVLQLRLPEFRYFFRGTVYGDWMGSHAFQRYGHIAPTDLWEINDSATLYRQVAGTDIKAIVMNKKPDVQFKPQEISSYRSHFEIVRETDGAVLMVPLPRPPESGGARPAR